MLAVSVATALILAASTPLDVRAQAPSGLELLQAARRRLPSGDTAAVRLWYEGARDDDSASVAAYLKDLGYLFTARDSAAFSERRGEARVAWLKEFWDQRDAESLHGEGERLMEHYRRLAFARQHFRLPEGPRQYHAWERVRTGSTEFDDRGVIYVRHGPPDHESGTPAGLEVARIKADTPATLVVRNPDNAQPVLNGGADDRTAGPMTGVGVPLSGAFMNPLARKSPMQLRKFAPPPMLAWRYERPEGDLVFYFRACTQLNPGDRDEAGALTGRLGLVGRPCPAPPDYRLVPSVLDFLHINPELALGTRSIRVSEGSAFSTWLLQLSGASDEARRLIGADIYSAPLLAREARDIGERHLAIGLGTDTYPLAFARQLEGRIELLRVGRKDDRDLLHVVYAINAADLTPIDEDGKPTARLRLRAVAQDARGSVLARLDTLRVIAAAAWPERGYLMGRAALELPPGAERVRLALFEELPAGMPAAGLVGGAQLLERREAPPLRLSDIVLGSPTVALSWMPTERDTVWFNPAGRFQRTVPL
ncbi:MAG: GWxTD domain-containing protein, partial [Gemmatimonadota bacterium]